MSIFAAAEIDTVFLYVEVEDVDRWNQGAQSDLTRRWWAYMADVMPTNPDSSPISADLRLVFHLD